MMKQNILIEVKNIVKFYKKDKVLNNLSLEIPKGKVTALIGPNGAGKSTLIKILLSIINYSSGNLKFSEKIRFAYAPEECKLYPELTVGYFLNWIGDVKNISKSKLQEYITEFQLEKHLNKKIKHLSKGYKRRLIIVQAIIGDENFVILDEPSDGLDIEFRFKLRNILGTILKNKTVLICSHETIILNELADKIIILDKGEKFFDGDVSSLKSNDGKLYIEDIYLRLKK